jgi:hypothetical protein
MFFVFTFIANFSAWINLCHHLASTLQYLHLHACRADASPSTLASGSDIGLLFLDIGHYWEQEWNMVHNRSNFFAKLNVLKQVETGLQLADFGWDRFRTSGSDHREELNTSPG